MHNLPLPEGIYQEAADPETEDVPGVLARLNAIQQIFHNKDKSLPDVEELTGRPDDLDTLSGLKKGHDGVACFNHLYRVITAEINCKIIEDKKIKASGRSNGDLFFHDDDFLADFDVVFAERYLAAIRGYADPSARDVTTTPRCWRLLFEHRNDHKISPMQFAMLGIACHVCCDLAIAVVQVCKNRRRELNHDTYEDYQKVNTIFHEKIPALRRHFENQIERRLDRSLIKHYTNYLSNLTVKESRDIAWNHALELWKVWEPPGNPERAKAEKDLDHFAVHIGRGILVRF